MWLKATYEFGSFFSYRIPDFSSQYAMSLLVPGPSAIKLAIVSTAIQHSRDISIGERIFNLIKNSEIVISLPKSVSANTFLIKRLKATKDKKSGKNFETTFGIRGYVHIPSEFSIFVKIDEGHEEVKSAMKKIRYFGTSDSLVFCKNISDEEPHDVSVNFLDNIKSVEKNTLIIPIKDINKEASFHDMNPFNSSRKRHKDTFTKKLCCLKITEPPQSGKNWTTYKFL